MSSCLDPSYSCNNTKISAYGAHHEQSSSLEFIIDIMINKQWSIQRNNDFVTHQNVTLKKCQFGVYVVTTYHIPWHWNSETW